MIKNIFQNIVLSYYEESDKRGYDWAGEAVAALNPPRLLDVGCGNGSRLFSYLQHRPTLFFGVEGNPALMQQARKCGLQVQAFDLNGAWPLESNCFDVVHSSQVIEHVHNTRQFLTEIYRVLVPGGHAVMTSENLCSLMNLAALAMGYTPFSLQGVCGWYLGNPLGLHAQQDIPIDFGELSPAAPEFSGVSGHVRVLSVSQARALLEKVGFVEVEVRSIGLMPLPRWLGYPLERLMPRRGHFLLMHARKPPQA